MGATPQFAELAKLEGEQKAAEKEQKAAEKAAEKGSSSPSKKRGSPAKAAKAAKVAKMAELAIDEATLKKAQSLGLESNLKTLASRDDIIANGVAHDKILSA